MSSVTKWYAKSKVLLIGLLWSFSANVQAAPITVLGPRIQLAEVLGPSAGKIEAAGDLGQAPLPGMKRRIYRQQVLALLGNEARPRLPAYWEVETQSQTLSCTELERQVVNALQEQLVTGLEVKSMTCSRPLTLPVGPLQLNARLSAGGNKAGRLNVLVQLQVGDWPTQTITTSVMIAGSLPVVVTRVDLLVGALLDSGDLRLEQRPAETLPSDVLTNIDEIQGKKLITRLGANTILRRGFMTDIPLIPKGDMVTISVLMNGIRITCRGIAREEGKRNDLITVLSLSANKLIKARVVETHQVVVDL